jgi:hypothetical protein
VTGALPQPAVKLAVTSAAATPRWRLVNFIFI